MPTYFATHHIAHHDTFRVAIYQHHIKHLRARKHLYLAETYLPGQRGVRAEQQLLARLAARVKRATHLCATEGTIGQQAAVLAREGHALRDALVNNVHAHLRESMYVGLARAIIAALHGVVKKPMRAVAIVLIILCRIDASLRSYGMRATRAVLKTETLHVIAQLRQRGCS